MHSNKFLSCAASWLPRPCLPSVLGLLLSDCAGSRLYYAGYLFDAPKIIESQRSEMVVHLYEAIPNQRIKSLVLITQEHGTQSLLPRDESSSLTIDWLPLPVLYVTPFILDTRYHGLEIDLMVHTEDGGYTPVTAQFDLEHKLRIEMGSPSKTLLPPAEGQSTRESLRARFALGDISDAERSWQALELYSLEQALDLLSPAGRRLAQGISFVRRTRASKSNKRLPPNRLWGLYTGTVGVSDARGISLFDTSSRHDEALIVGTPKRPCLATTMYLRHEIGHAIADYARVQTYKLRRQQTAAHNAVVEEWNLLRAKGQLSKERASALDACLKTLQNEAAQNAPRQKSIAEQYERELSPVIAAYRIARRRGNDPTPYARTDDEESFADAFALYRADPEALLRISASLYECFAGDGHLQALRDTLAE